MNYLFSILLSITQGLTEFLPISSSGHLLFLHSVLDFNLSDNLSFDVALHLGTLVAIIIFFWRDIISLIKVWFQSWPHILNNMHHHRQLIFSGILKKRNGKKNKDQNQNNEHIVVSGVLNKQDLHWEERLAWGILFGTIPVFVAGYYLENYINIMFHNLLWVAISLIIVGIFFFVAEKKWQSNFRLDNITIGKAFIIGCFQALALLPGVSRSGITILAGMKQNLNRVAAARFSFLLSIPAVFGAGAKKTLDFISSGNLNQELNLIIIGFLVSAIIGYLTIKYFLKFLEKYSLHVFAYYRIILGIIILFLIFR